MGEPSTFQGSSKPWRPPFSKIYNLYQHQQLENYFRKNPYPTRKVKKSLAARLHLKENQVLKWFVRHRAAQAQAQSRPQWLPRGFRPTSVSHVTESLPGHQELTYYRSVQKGFLHHKAATSLPGDHSQHTLPGGDLGASAPDGRPCSGHMLLCRGLRSSTRKDAARRPWDPHHPTDEVDGDVAPPGLSSALDALQKLSVSDTPVGAQDTSESLTPGAS